MGPLQSIFASHSEPLYWPDEIKVHSLVVLGRGHVGSVCHVVETEEIFTAHFNCRTLQNVLGIGVFMPILRLSVTM